MRPGQTAKRCGTEAQQPVPFHSTDKKHFRPFHSKLKPCSQLHTTSDGAALHCPTFFSTRGPAWGKSVAWFSSVHSAEHGQEITGSISLRRYEISKYGKFLSQYLLITVSTSGTRLIPHRRRDDREDHRHESLSGNRFLKCSRVNHAPPCHLRKLNHRMHVKTGGRGSCRICWSMGKTEIRICTGFVAEHCEGRTRSASLGEICPPTSRDFSGFRIKYMSINKRLEKREREEYGETKSPLVASDIRSALRLSAHRQIWLFILPWCVRSPDGGKSDPRRSPDRVRRVREGYLRGYRLGNVRATGLATLLQILFQPPQH